MAKQEITFTLTLEYDPEKNNNKPVNIFLFQFVTRLNREWPVLELIYKNTKKVFRKGEDDINKIALRKVDSVDDDDLQKKPDWLKFKTNLPKEKKIIKK